MTISHAWSVVEGVLTSSSLSFTTLGFLPGKPGAMLDDNFPPDAVPLAGGIRLSLAQGNTLTTASPGATAESLVFVVELNIPLGEGNARVNTYPGEVASLFIAKSFPPPVGSGGNGALICERIATDRIGQPSDGRLLYKVNVNVVFSNRSYIT